jgi:hypothetical protein
MDTTTRTYPPGDIRASDADRDQVLSELTGHFEAGRLTKEEFDDRSGRALTARTRGELAGLMTDLPGTGLPGTGLPGTGLPGTGLPGTGLPGTGLPGTGLPGTGPPGTGPDGGPAGAVRAGGWPGWSLPVMATPLAATAIVLAVLIGIGHVGWAPWWILVAGLLLARCRSSGAGAGRNAAATSPSVIGDTHGSGTDRSGTDGSGELISGGCGA